MNTVRVTVKLFGPLKDLVGTDEMLLDVPAPYTGETALGMLQQMKPAVKDWRQSLRLAVNLEYAGLDTVLSTNDEISFIPPVSGG